MTASSRTALTSSGRIPAWDWRAQIKGREAILPAISGCQHAAGAQTQKDIRPADDLAQGTRGGGLGKTLFHRIHQFAAALVNDTGEIGQPDVFPLRPRSSKSSTQAAARSLRR